LAGANIRQGNFDNCQGATIEFDAHPFPVAPSIVSFSSEETDIINREIDKLLAKGIIETTSHELDETLSNILSDPKKMAAIDLSLTSQVLTNTSHTITSKWTPYTLC